jgi:sugar phosphate isomerase/epimerase
MPPHLSVSNIGFPPSELEQALALVVELGVNAIEVAPYNVFGRWDIPNDDIDLLRGRLSDVGIHCPAVQGIVYNAGPVHLFESPESRDMLFQHLVLVARMAGRLGAKACVFGGPRLRDPGELAPEAARAIAIEFLRRIGPVFAAEGTILAVEPNARRYACRFITTTAEAIDLLDEVDVAGVGLQIDTGTVFLEHEDPTILSRAASYAAHAHVSEPDLAPVGSSEVDHRPLAEAMRVGGYEGSLSIEMKSVPDWPFAIRRAVAFTREIYLR